MSTMGFRPNRKADRGVLSDIDGKGLLELFHGWVSTLDRQRIKDTSKQRYVRIVEVLPEGHSVTVITEAGDYGEPGNTYNTDTDKIAHEQKDNEAATDRTRTTLVVPPGSKIGLFMIERKGSSGGGSKLFDEFHRQLGQIYEDHWFPTEAVIESSAWSKTAGLKEITVVAHSVPLDLGKNVNMQRRVIGELSQTIVPLRGDKYFPVAVWDALRARKVEASEIIGFENIPVDDTFVTVERDGQTKKFRIGSDGSPAIRLQLTDHGEKALTDTEFKKRAFNEAKDYYKAMHFSWQSQWVKGKWTKTQLGVRLE